VEEGVLAFKSLERERAGHMELPQVSHFPLGCLTEEAGKLLSRGEAFHAKKKIQILTNRA
jgi:hypothetical protein